MQREVWKHKKHLAQKYENACKYVALWLQRQSQMLVPVDTGALRNSAYTRHVGRGFDITVWVGYTVEYAVYVHERLDVHHPIGQAKFLEEPMQTKQPQMAKLFAKLMK